MKTDMELMIYSSKKKKYFLPAVEEGVSLLSERYGSPTKLEFKVIKDKTLAFTEGDPVRLSVNNHKLFYGFIFKKKRDKEGIITVTAYDQLRYLKNKDTYVYEDKKASDLINMIAADFNLNVGTVADTGYKIASRTEDNVTLFDIIQNALDLTLTNTGKMFVLYDDFGKLTLKNIEDMKVGKNNKYLLITDESAENFDYEVSIDGDTYNQVKLVHDDKKAGKREAYIAKSSENINKWGVLQYYDKLEDGENGQAKADALLGLYNTPARTLQFKNCKGDYRVRGGSMVIVKMALGDIKLHNWMIVEKAKHTIKESEWMMDLTVRGGEIG